MSTAVSRRQADPVAAEVRQLHQNIEAALRESVRHATRIGELLTAKKAELEHGLFLTWIHENCGFTDRTARNYMQLYRWREDISKTETVSDLSSAYRKVEQLENRERSRKPTNGESRAAPGAAEPVVDQDEVQERRPAGSPPSKPTAPDPKFAASLDRLREKAEAMPEEDPVVLTGRVGVRLKAARDAADRFYEMSLSGRCGKELETAAQDLMQKLGALLQEIAGKEASR